MLEENKLRVYVVAMGFTTSVAIALFLLFLDSRNSAEIVEFGVSSLASVLATYSLFAKYSTLKKHAMPQQQKIEKVELRCPNCRSSNVLVDGNNIYCLDCGGVYRLELAIPKT